MRQIFDSFQEGHTYAQLESKKKKQIHILCKFSINGIKYTVIDDKEILWEGETPLQKYNDKGEII